MITLSQIQDVLSNQTFDYIEKLARKAKKITEQFFGRTISLYAPLYLSNYCESYCTYCGFNNHNKIKRIKLTTAQMHIEMQYISVQKIENILLLTGESHQLTPIKYLKEAVKIAKKYFTGIGLEVYPMEISEYRELYLEGVDSITVYQETYDKQQYKQVHLSGRKVDYDFRYKTPERIAQSGIRQLSLGILLGLGPLDKDLFSLFEHLHWLEKNYPGIEYSISFPRLQSIKGQSVTKNTVDDITLIKIICLSRILFPRVGINLSTRESEELRNNLLGIGVTRISAGSKTSVGGYKINNIKEQEPQFDIRDNRNVDDIIGFLKKNNFDPVLTDWRPIQNL